MGTPLYSFNSFSYIFRLECSTHKSLILVKSKRHIIVNCLSYKHFLTGNLCFKFPLLRKQRNKGRQLIEKPMFQYFIPFEMTQMVNELSPFNLKLPKSEEAVLDIKDSSYQVIFLTDKFAADIIQSYMILNKPGTTYIFYIM